MSESFNFACPLKNKKSGQISEYENAGYELRPATAP